jgi:carbonic anhydrase/acetyltransferase-like protein (isoleucine patch superfamily)
MALIKTVRGFTPIFSNDCWLAENATIVGQVSLGRSCSVWFNAVLRGDVNAITIGDFCNIQDGAVIHGTFERAETILGNYVSVGHNAIVHGAKLGNNVLVGMGAIVMDNVIVEDNVLIGAGSIVLQNTVLKSGWLYAGNPAKPIKPLDEKLLDGEIKRIAQNYEKYSGWFK